MRRLWIVLFFTVTSHFASAQTIGLDSSKALVLIDTLFIDHDLNNWSIRFLSNIRDVRFRFKNDVEDVRYIPTNIVGFGFGVASRKFIMDFNFSLKSNEEYETDMFNMLGTAVLGKHIFEAYLQDFEGFNQRNLLSGEESFRPDASSLVMGVFYRQSLNSSKYSITSLRSGLDYQKKSAISPMIGGFFLFDRLKADSALIGFEPNIPEISRYRGIGIGGSAGVSGLLALPYNFFAAASIMPSAGFMYKIVETSDAIITEGNPMIFMLNSSATVGYNGHKIYVNLTVQTARSTTELPYSMSQNLQQFNAKLAIGYKLFREPRTKK